MKLSAAPTATMTTVSATIHAVRLQAVTAISGTRSNPTMISTTGRRIRPPTIIAAGTSARGAFVSIRSPRSLRGASRMPPASSAVDNLAPPAIIRPMSDDTLAIRELVENWVVWRDAGDWDRFRTVWHDDGRMMATWFQGSADDFIRVSREGWDRGVSILHFLGGMSIDIAAHRAVAQTKMTISQRARVHDVLCDVVCTGRFY